MQLGDPPGSRSATEPPAVVLQAHARVADARHVPGVLQLDPGARDQLARARVDAALRMSTGVPGGRLADHLASADRCAKDKLGPPMATWIGAMMIATIQRHPASGELWLTVSHDAGGSAGSVDADSAIVTGGFALLGGALPAGHTVAVGNVDPKDVDVAMGSGAWIAAVKVGSAPAVTTTIRDGDGRFDSWQHWNLPNVRVATHRDVKTP